MNRVLRALRSVSRCLSEWLFLEHLCINRSVSRNHNQIINISLHHSFNNAVPTTTTKRKTKIKLVCLCGLSRVFGLSESKGSHSPGPRALSMGVYPIQTLKSQVLDHEDVSVRQDERVCCRSFLLPVQLHSFSRFVARFIVHTFCFGFFSAAAALQCTAPPPVFCFNSIFIAKQKQCRDHKNNAHSHKRYYKIHHRNYVALASSHHDILLHRSWMDLVLYIDICILRI